MTDPGTLLLAQLQNEEWGRKILEITGLTPVQTAVLTIAVDPENPGPTSAGLETRLPAGTFVTGVAFYVALGDAFDSDDTNTLEATVVYGEGHSAVLASVADASVEGGQTITNFKPFYSPVGLDTSVGVTVDYDPGDFEDLSQGSATVVVSYVVLT